jgi:hypothetical protein
MPRHHGAEEAPLGGWRTEGTEGEADPSDLWGENQCTRAITTSKHIVKTEKRVAKKQFIQSIEESHQSSEISASSRVRKVRHSEAT